MRDQRDPEDLIVGDLRPPYTDRIMAEDIPRHFRVPQMEPYDGTSDPLDHLGNFKARMMIQGASDAMYCLAFPATLKKSARMWYSSLRPGTIDSFSELEKLFVLHFRTCRKTPRNTDTLFLLHQNEGESLRDYISRFNAATLEIPDLNEHVAMSALKKGLRTSRLTFSLDKKFPKSYAELLSRAQKYAAAEEQAANR